MLPNITHENAPHTGTITIQINVNQLKNTGEMFPVTKNKPLIWQKKFKNLTEAKEWESKIIEKLNGVLDEH